jgi:hypothetical protein
MGDFYKDRYEDELTPQERTLTQRHAEQVKQYWKEASREIFAECMFMGKSIMGAVHFFAPFACLSMRREKVCLPQRYCASVRPVFCRGA